MFGVSDLVSDLEARSERVPRFFVPERDLPDGDRNLSFPGLAQHYSGRSAVPTNFRGVPDVSSGFLRRFDAVLSCVSRPETMSRALLYISRPGACFSWEFRDCGRDACWNCPHGPYLYVTYSDAGRRVRRYLGR